jgi:hypothetical protein
MGKFNEYTQKATPADNDTLMIYDAAAKANKLSPFSGIWNWIVGKLTNAVISNLQTNNKSVVGALNELNSNLPGIEFLTRTITAESEKKEYDLQINATEYMIISIQAEDRMGWQYTVTHGVSGTEATQNWAICFIGNPTGNFTFKIAVLKIK